MRFDPVADALRRRQAAGTCEVCGGNLIDIKGAKRCVDDLQDGSHGRGVGKFPRRAVRTLPRRK